MALRISVVVNIGPLYTTKVWSRFAPFVLRFWRTLTRKIRSILHTRPIFKAAMRLRDIMPS